ncbi:MAG: family 16 glycosylhydrolase, partial [Mycobacterium sp.]
MGEDAMGYMGGQSNRYWLGAGMMAVGLGAAIASGQGVALAAAEDAGGSAASGAKPAAAEREQSSTSPGGTEAAESRTARGSRPERTARPTPEARRSVTTRRAAEVGIHAPRTVTVGTVAVDPPSPDDPAAGAAGKDPDDLGDTAYDRRRTFAETRPLRPERRIQATVWEAAEQRRATVSPATSATGPADSSSVAAPAVALSAASTVLAAPSAQANVAAAKPVTIGGFVKSMLARVSLKFTLPKGMQNWWRDVRRRIFGVPATPVVVPPTEPVTPNPTGPGPVGSPPTADAPVLSAGFHDYGIDWYPDRIIWHVDGVETGRVTKAQYEALGGDWTP